MSAQSMSQLPLFAQASETVLVDDARGRILYTPDFLPVEVARAWFDRFEGAGLDGVVVKQVVVHGDDRGLRTVLGARLPERIPHPRVDRCRV